MEELADLGFKIRLMLQQWKQDLAQADQVFNQYKMKWEAPIKFGGGSMAGGGGGMFTPGVASAPGPSSSPAQAAMSNAVANTNATHARVQAAPQQAGEAAGWNFRGIYKPKVSDVSMGMPATQFEGGPAFTGLASIGGSPFGSRPGVSPGVNPVEEFRRSQVLEQQSRLKDRLENPIGVRPGLSPIAQELSRRDDVMFQQQLKFDKLRMDSLPNAIDQLPGRKGTAFNGSITAGGVGGLIGPHDPLSIKGVKGQFFNPIETPLMEGLNSMLGTSVSFGGTDGKGGGSSNKLGPQGKMGLRNIVYGTIYGLVADVVAQGIGAASQYGAGMSLTGNNQGKQGLLLTGAVRHGLGSVPIIGGALSSLYGAVGADKSDAQIMLAGLQDISTDRSTRAGFTNVERGYASSIAGYGAAAPYGARGTEIASHHTDIQKQNMDAKSAAMQAWNDANPEASTSDKLKAYNKAHNIKMSDSRVALDALKISATGGLAQGSGRVVEGGDILAEERIKASQTYAGYLNRKYDRDPSKEERRTMDRDFEYDKNTMQNSINRSSVANRYTPYAAQGRFELAQFETETSRLTQTPGDNSKDWQLLLQKGRLASNSLGMAQRDVAEQVAFGGVRQYNPYTESTLSFTDRSKETSIDAYNSLQKAIEDLNATIQNLQRQHP